jgi:hypothetical protein
MSKRVSISAATVEAVKEADKRLAAREREGMPDLPAGHPAYRAILAQRQRDALGAERQKVRKAKKVDAKSDAENKEKSARMQEALKIITQLTSKATGLDKELREIYDMSMTCSEMFGDQPVMRVRFGRLSRMVFSFHAMLRDCCGPLIHIVQQQTQPSAPAKKEE